MTRTGIATSQHQVPFLHEKQIEREADFLLESFSIKFREIAKPPVPVDEIVELHLQLALELKDMKSLFPFADVHGAIWFEEGLIGIDQSLDPETDPKRLGRYHFTLAHETGHWQLHRQHFGGDAQQRLLFEDGSRQPDVVCRSSQRKVPVEWQADMFAANLLMPRRMVYDVWHEWRQTDSAIEIREIVEAATETPLSYTGQPLTDPLEIETALKDEFCLPMAEKFEVSREAMRIRLEYLNLIVKQRPATLF